MKEKIMLTKNEANEMRELAEKLDDEFNNGNKSDIWACMKYNQLKCLSPTSKKTKCAICKETIVYDSAMADRVLKNHKKVCIECVMKNFDKLSNPKQKEFIKLVAEKQNDKQNYKTHLG